jgi:DNA-binding transcriptional MerR regulator
MAYSIKKIAALAGVTTRTIRYYDEIGLLKPANTGENGYRYYDRESLLRLQQILFFRELEIPLDEILLIMSQPDFNISEALEKHRVALNSQALRLKQLLKTLDNTILIIKGEKEMKENELFEGFDETKYEEEARQRWGHTLQYKESQRRWASYSKEQKQEIKQEGSHFAERIVTANPNAKADDPQVQEAVSDYYAFINKYFYTCDVEFMRNLSDMWVQDPRFASNYERIREGGASFARDAVHLFCDKNKK